MLVSLNDNKRRVSSQLCYLWNTLLGFFVSCLHLAEDQSADFGEITEVHVVLFVHSVLALKVLLSFAALTTATAIRAAKAVESRLSKRFKLKSVRESERKSQNDVEVSDAVQMEILPHTSSTPETDSKPTSILVFADSIQSRDNRGASDTNSAGIVNTDTRGAAALQLFLLTYISPVEICLRMLTCYSLDSL